MAEPSTCDCLNKCGDDPWLADGRATPCEDLKRWQQRKAAQLALMAERDKAREKYRRKLDDNPDSLQLTITREDLEALLLEIKRDE